jgi:DNA-binding SARP family transcriptional activator
MLQIKLFGPGQATYFGEPIANFPSQQPHQLLCYLVLHAHYPLLRDQVASTFWGEHPTAVSRKYLRNALWKLRQSFECLGADLDTYLLINDESLTVRKASPFWLDVEIFEAATASCQGLSGKELSADQADLLAEAVEIYTGDLLEGVYCEWCLYERERLSLLYLSALTKLASYHEHKGNWELGLDYARNILARDNTRERIHLQMMRLYWMAGDRDSALAQYRRCAQILGDELGIAPMRETALVYHQMAHNQYIPERPGIEPLPALSSSPARGKSPAQNENSLHTLAEKTLQRVQYLQAMLEETRSELRQIESLIHQELLNTDPVK